jgi:small-conductance mechanosensitive channel
LGLVTAAGYRVPGAGREEEQRVQDPQIDLSARVADVKRRTRPWRSIIALVIAIAAAIISRQRRADSNALFSASHLTNQVIAYGTAGLFGLFGALATFGLGGQVRTVLERRVSPAHAAVVRYVVLIVGAFITLVITLDLLGVPVTQLVLGGALTSVFVGIAAQQSLSNVFAGLVLLFAHPFLVGDPIRLQAGALGGTLDGTVVEIGITYVRLETEGRVMSIPNSQVLNAVIGPIPPAVDEDEEEPAEVAPAASAGGLGSPGGPEQPQPAPPGPA